MRRLIAILGFITLFGCPLAGQALDKTPINDVYVVIFVMDGLNYNTFMKAVDEGCAPNIKKYFIDDGAYFTNAISLFPSASAPVYQSIVSGLYPGHSGIVYLGWFDRQDQKPICYFTPSGHKRIDEDFLNLDALFDPGEKRLSLPSTIFDHLAGYETAAIYSSFNRGASLIEPEIPVAAGWSVFASGREEMLDIYAYRKIRKLFERPEERIPRFTIAGLYGFDTMGHHFGPSSSMVAYNLELFDNFLGEFIARLKERNLFDKTYIVIASDHGMHNTPSSRFDLKKYVAEMGLTIYPGHHGSLSSSSTKAKISVAPAGKEDERKTRRRSYSYVDGFFVKSDAASRMPVKFAAGGDEDRLPRKGDYNAFVMDRGIGSAHIYIKGETGWGGRPDYNLLRSYPLASGKIDIVKHLIEAKEIKFVIARDGDNRFHVFGKIGHGLITTKGVGANITYNYKILEGADPLELKNTKAAALAPGRFLDDETWGKASATHKYPDAVVQLSQVFADGRAGDMFIIAEDDWVFYRGKAGTHGSIIRDDMHIPLLIRGPGVKNGKFGFARVSDIYPAMLEWYGINVKASYYNGRNPFNRQKKAAPK